jgi:cytochrome c oxidase cbb3-type subunit III
VLPKNRIFLCGFAVVVLTSSAWAQDPKQSPPQKPPSTNSGNTPVAPSGAPAALQNAQPPNTGRVRRSAYPDRGSADPAAISRGKAVFGVNCAFCHGSDARGGEGGPNLIRSELVLNDKIGELIGQVVHNGRVDKGMPKFNLPDPTIADIASYIHSFKVGGYDVSRQQPLSILVGDAKSGEADFKTTCAGCHSLTGDLKGFGGKFSDPKILQQTWLMPGGSGRGFPGQQVADVHVPPITVSVTLPDGQKVDGKLGRIDDFIVTLTDGEGNEQSFARNGDTPKVEIHDPLKPHRELLPKYTDKQIHDLTAFLVTVK